MALPGYYLVNFTDPRKPSFVIEPYQTDGGITPTSPIPHGLARRISTSMLLYGRDVPNYGERIAENFVHLLENFAGPTAPQAPIEGQLWFDTGSSYDIVAWTNATTLTIGGDRQAEFTKYILDGTVLNLAFRPINAALDNSHQVVKVLAKSVAVAAGNTIVSFVSDTNEPIEIPATVVGGFLIADSAHYSRMRVATKVGSEVKWVDVTNVYSSEDAPEVTNRMVGDLWLDVDTNQLNVYGTNGWQSVAARYVPLTGGTMTGDLQMGANRIFSSAVTNNTPAHQYALINRTYVDGVQKSLQDQITKLQQDVGSVSGDGLSGKVSRTGDEMTGALVFGEGNSTSTVARGIDMNNNPIVRLSITWNAADYLSASFQPTHATTKQYVAQAFKQHLLDEAHGAGGFIQIQNDGSGLIPNNVFFNAGTAGQSYSLKWKDISGNNEHSIYANFSGATSQLVLQAGSDSADSVDIRHSVHSPTANPLFSFLSTYTRSFNSLFIHDGQPQPQDDDTPTALVDDNKAATKGFCRQLVIDSLSNVDTGGGSGTTVTSLTYGYNVDAATYSLTLLQDNGAAPLIANLYHKHRPNDITMLYSPPQLGNWSEIDTDNLTTYLQGVSGTYPEVSVEQYLKGLTYHRAPLVDAIFDNLPRCGIDAEVLEYNTTDKTIRVYGSDAMAAPIGHTLVLTGTSGNNGTYTIVAVAAGAIAGGEDTTVITVAEPLAVNGAELSEDATFKVGQYAARTQPDAMVTRATLDYELDKLEPKYTYWKATAAGTNVVRNLGFTYTTGKNKLWVFKNGQKMRVNMMAGGDFNETSTTTITIGTVSVDDEFEIYEI